MNPINFNGMNKTQVRQLSDPNSYAENYAQKNGISLQEAKSQLQAKYGNPTEPTANTNSNTELNLDEYPQELDDNSGLSGIFNKFKGIFKKQNTAPKTDPDEYARTYAAQHKISFEEAKAELKQKYGDPQQK